MADYIRRLVSGNKARFKDTELKLELDLVYLTDQIIIMGYPATGMEGWYRNKREDARTFLDHRHKNNYWIFNFCPLRENSYDSEFFYGRVSRYPFPDHHAPPLALLPLVAREMRAWLSGSPDRVAVLHCKAGKGRSGTMACAYLLSLDDTTPTAPKLQRSYTTKQWAQLRAENAMDVVPADVDDRHRDSVADETASRSEPSNGDGATVLANDPETATPHRTESPSPISPKSTQLLPPALTNVLDLHTSRRMKSPSSPSKKLKQGVSIPSQRRWLYYWALVLAHSAPDMIWPPFPNNSAIPVSPYAEANQGNDASVYPSTASSISKRKVRLNTIVVRMRAQESVSTSRRATIGLVKAASKIVEQAKGGKTKNGTESGLAEEETKVWVSLARYDDDFVGILEEWERRTREGGEDPSQVRMGVRKPGSEHVGDEELGKLFEGGKWDKDKMVRSFARMGVVDVSKANGKGKEVVQEDQVDVYTLRPLTTRKWDTLRNELERQEKESNDNNGMGEKEEAKKEKNDFLDNATNFVPASEANSIYDIPVQVQQQQQQQTKDRRDEKNGGVVVDAAREVRIKLYIGLVFMGWLWFIPAFHLPPPSNDSPRSSKEQGQEQEHDRGPTKFRLTRKELDFPLGIGKDIVDVEIEMEWDGLDETAVQVKGMRSDGEAAGGGVAAAVASAITADKGAMNNVVEVAQAAND